MIVNQLFKNVCQVQNDCSVNVCVRILTAGSSFSQGLGADSIMVYHVVFSFHLHQEC